MNKLKILTDGLNALEQFFKEQEKFENALRQISSGIVLELGNVFIDRYIQTLADVLQDDHDYISWFVFDCKFGKKKLTAEVNGKSIGIVNTPSKLLKLIDK
ncbi:MAG: hypothetical protein IPL26_12970 [Leptospiraceae bacterium]|nr:hypothetical protein [Leptospiraceae bacterium]